MLGASPSHRIPVQHSVFQEKQWVRRAFSGPLFPQQWQRCARLTPSHGAPRAQEYPCDEGKSEPGLNQTLRDPKARKYNKDLIRHLGAASKSQLAACPPTLHMCC